MVNASGRTNPECSGDCDQFPGLGSQNPGNDEEIAFAGLNWEHGYICPEPVRLQTKKR
jgi:hypothetical protein